MSTTDQADICTAAENRSPPNAPDLESIKIEIKKYQENSNEAYLKIGLLLLEVKRIKPHGQWIPWIQDNTELSVCKAQRLMRVAAWLDKNEAPMPHLTFIQAYILCKLSQKELEEFGEFISGMEKVKGMSKRELEAKIRDFLKQKRRKSSTVQAPQQAEVRTSDKDDLLNRLDQIKSEVTALANLVDSASDKYDVFAVELCELCQTIIQKLLPENVENI